MKKLSLFFFCICSISLRAQVDSIQAVAEIKAFQKHLNEEYQDRQKSPLNNQDFAKFTGHDFFPIDLEYRVIAKLEVTNGTPFFAMKTTTSMPSTERVYGYVNFSLQGKEFRMPVYQSQDLMKTAEYADYLFFPFTDKTNGDQTYSGGRYIDLRIPKEGNDLVIDFNMAYNPYCAYSPNYSCPLVPAENQMDIEVPVGVGYLKTPKSSDEVFVMVDVQPEFPGGYENMLRFIKRNMHYPKSAMKEKIKGMAYVSFVVDREGKVTDVKTVKSLSPECDREAERVIWMMPKWKPGSLNGVNVAVRFVMPFNFHP